MTDKQSANQKITVSIDLHSPSVGAPDIVQSRHDETDLRIRAYARDVGKGFPPPNADSWRYNAQAQRLHE